MTTEEYIAAKAAERAAVEAERAAREAKREAYAAEKYAEYKAAGRIAARRYTPGKMTVAEAKCMAATHAIMRMAEEARA